MPPTSLDSTVTEASATKPRPLPISVGPRPDAVWPTAQEARDRLRVHVVVIAVIAVLTAYLLWRATVTITPLSLLLGVALLALEVWSLASLAMQAVVLWDVDVVATPAVMASTTARVAVIIPTRDESHQVLMPTLAAAARMRMATEVLVLDDGHRPWLAGMCDELGIDYRTRLRHDGGTAAQLNCVLSTLDADFVVILAADQVANRDLIGRTLAHFDDTRVALVQTPIDFYNEDSFEHIRHGRVLVAAQAAFDRLVGAGRNRVNAAFWAGGAAIFRRSALATVGGVSTGTTAPGIETSLALHRKGWRTIQHNEVLARGLGAVDAAEYADRRAAAGSGALEVLRRRRVLRGRGLTAGQRIAYLAALTDVLSAWRVLGYSLVPAAALLLAMTPAAGPVAVFVIAFPLSFAARRVARVALGRGRAAYREHTQFALIRLAPTLRASTTLLTGRPVSPRHPSRDPRRVPILLWVLLAVNVVGLLWAAAAATGLVSVAYPYRLIVLGAAVWSAGTVVTLVRAMARIRSRHFGGDRRQAHRIEVDGHVYLDGARVHVMDLSLTGVRALSYGDVPEVGSYCALTFTDPSRRPAIVTGTVAGIHRRPHGHELRVELEPDQTYVMGAILADALVRAG